MPHINEKIDFTVEVFVVYKDRVLLRKHDKYGIWLSVGGHIDPDEDPEEAAVREVKEEVGLSIELSSARKPELEEREGEKELIPPEFLNRHTISPTHEHVSMTYFATTPNDTVSIEYEEDASNEWKWVSREELNTMELTPRVRFYATRALQALSEASEE